MDLAAGRLLSHTHIGGDAFRAWRERVDRFAVETRYGTPVRRGGLLYLTTSAANGTGNRRLTVMPAQGGPPRIVLGPDQIAPDDALVGVSVSRTSRYIAYTTARGASRWLRLRVWDRREEAILSVTLDGLHSSMQQPSANERIVYVNLVADRLIVFRIRDAAPLVTIHDLDGGRERTVSLPPLATVWGPGGGGPGFLGTRTDSDAFFVTTSGARSSDRDLSADRVTASSSPGPIVTCVPLNLRSRRRTHGEVSHRRGGGHG